MAKNKSFLGKLFLAAGIFAGVNVAGSALIARKNQLKMEEHMEGCFNIMHCETLGKNVVEVSEKIDHAYLSCLTGASDINIVPRADKKDLYMDLTAVCAKINIFLPADAKIEWDGDEICTKVIDDRETCEDECSFTVYLKRQTCGATIHIGTVVDAQ